MKPTTVLLALLLAAFSTTAFAQTPVNSYPLPGVITVSGNSQVLAIPDEATVRIGILRQAGAAREAQDEASKIGAAILKAIGGLGVPPQRIQTSRLTISPVYAQQRQNPGGVVDTPARIAGYVASNTISVTLDNLALIGPIVDAGLDNGANQLEGVQFRLKLDGPVREQALREAVAEAKGKAVAMADALQVTLGPVVEVTEDGASVVPVGERGEAVFALSARASVPTPVSAGQLEIRANVVLRYAIIQR